MNDPTEPEPLDAEFEPADDSAASEKQRKSGGIGGYFLTFVLSVLIGGGMGGWIAWTLDGPDDAAILETRIAALEARPAPAVFDASTLEARLAKQLEAIDEHNDRLYSDLCRQRPAKVATTSTLRLTKRRMTTSPRTITTTRSPPSRNLKTS